MEDEKQIIKKLDGANMDIDLTTEQKDIYIVTWWAKRSYK